jgi:PEP-CTERM motif-containing protein
MRSIILAVGLVTILVAGNAAAIPVTVTGGFTSFDGVVGGTDNGITQTLNGTQLCATAGCNATGAASVTFAPTESVEFVNTSGVTNIISFTPTAAQDVPTIVPTNTFLLGSVFFQNGIWTGDASFGFTLTTQSADPLLDNHTFTDILKYTLTPNDFVNHTPQQNADFISFTGNPLLGSGRAYELNDTPDPVHLNTVKFDVFGRITSLHLDLTSFANPVGGFLDPSVGLQPTSVVPEPSTLLLLGSALVGLVAWRWNHAA